MAQKLVTYTGENITPCGTCEVTETYDIQQYHQPLVAVPGLGPTLLGWKWLEVIQLSWNRIHQVKGVNATPVVEDIIQRYTDVFKDKLGELRNYTASLRVDPNTKPIFCKAYHVPYALREKVGKELDRLESLGIIESIQYSEWAASIVAVLKTDQSIRQCGDYKMTVDKCTNLDSYFITNIEELYMKLSQGGKFAKPDLRSAFLQVSLHKDSKKFLAIYTPLGLYQFNHLSFGVKSAPGIYQCCMVNLAARETRVVNYQDGILITGSSDAEHLDNLDNLESWWNSQPLASESDLINANSWLH